MRSCCPVRRGEASAGVLVVAPLVVRRVLVPRRVATEEAELDGPRVVAGQVGWLRLVQWRVVAGLGGRAPRRYGVKQHGLGQQRTGLHRRWALEHRWWH